MRQEYYGEEPIEGGDVPVDAWTAAANPAPVVPPQFGASSGAMPDLPAMNAATATVNAASNVDYWGASNFGPDSEAFFTLAVAADSDLEMGVFLRLVQEGSGATADGYLCAVQELATDATGHYRLDNGATTLLGATIAQEFANGDALGEEIIGSTLQAYRRPSGGSWATLGTTRSDSAHAAAGKLGLLITSTTARLDAFGGGTVVAAGAVTLYGRGALLSGIRNSVIQRV